MGTFVICWKTCNKCKGKHMGYRFDAFDDKLRKYYKSESDHKERDGYCCNEGQHVKWECFNDGGSIVILDEMELAVWEH